MVGFPLPPFPFPSIRSPDMAYESEATRFLRDLLDKHPELRELRNRNRATWWDRPQDQEVQREQDAARVEQGAYVYFPPPPSPDKPGA
jgi:hypothetical protein